MIKKDVKKYLITAALMITAYLAFLIVKPFIAALLTGFVLAYIFFPFYKKIKNLTKNEIISSLITTLIVIIIMLLPLIYLSNALVTESLNLYRQGIIEKTTEKISEYLKDDPTLAATINDSLGKIVIFIKLKATDFIANIPSRIFELLIIIYTTFASFISGEKFLEKAKKVLPVKKKDYMVKNIGQITHAIVYGLFVTAIIEFAIAFIVFKIMGVGAALLLALAIGFLAFIPMLGPSIVWVPYAIIEALRNNYITTTIIIILGISLFIIETFVKPKIIGDRSKIHPVVILVGTIGGLKLFGFIGLIVGPVILSAITIIIEEYYTGIENET